MGKTWIVLTERDYRSSCWSGGTTTQIAIAPRDASYGQRDFLWRISSAAVEQEQSTFTPLPDYDRLLATLEGEIQLEHAGGGSTLLKPLQIHAFDGADPTVSCGRCRDFNLMLRKGRAKGEMKALRLRHAAEILPGDPRGGDQLLFCASGTVSVTDGERAVPLSPGESLLTEAASSLQLTAGEEETVLLCCRMRICDNPEKGKS